MTIALKSVWPSRAERAVDLYGKLGAYVFAGRLLPGVLDKKARECLTLQMIASIRRIEYTAALRKRTIDPAQADPLNIRFDPERAIVYHKENHNLDEAIWLAFLVTHFGKHAKHDWKMLTDVYSGLGQSPWFWDRIKTEKSAFRKWLVENEKYIGGGFGNHRKYESLNGDRRSGTGAVIESFVDWLDGFPVGTLDKLSRGAGNSPEARFELLYTRMKVARFGRLGKFDFLSLIGRHGILDILPGHAYLVGATGPVRGGKLLFTGSPNGSINVGELERHLVELDEVLDVGMQVMEDSLCNWQKSPRSFVHFKG